MPTQIRMSNITSQLSEYMIIHRKPVYGDLSIVVNHFKRNNVHNRM